MRGVVRVVLTVAVLACAGLSAARGDDFPSKPITIMVGLAPGGITDVTARLYAEAVSRSIGQRITIENRTAAAGALASAAVQDAPPGGSQQLVFPRARPPGAQGAAAGRSGQRLFLHHSAVHQSNRFPGRARQSVGDIVRAVLAR